MYIKKNIFYLKWYLNLELSVKQFSGAYTEISDHLILELMIW